jgi:hypothetical protein
MSGFRAGGAEIDMAETVYEQYSWIARYIESAAPCGCDAKGGGT